MRHVRSLVLTAAIALAAPLSGPALALGPISFGPSLGSAGWNDFTFRGRDPVEFRPEGADTLHVRSDAAASMIWRALPADFADGSIAQWRWKVDRGVPPTDLSDRRVDDRSLALYFLFADDPATLADPPTSLRAAMMKGRALVYVWGGDEAAGSVIRSPTMFGRGQIVVTQPATGPNGTWISESVDLRADFRRAFGREPGPLMAVGVSADSDNTGTRADASLADLVIE